MRQGPHPLSVHLGMAGVGLLAEQDNLPALVPMISGIKRYQASSYQPNLPPREIIWRKGAVTLQKTIPLTGASWKNRVCLLIPSLINNAEIMDLCAERSLARWLEDQGISTCILNWGSIADDAGISDLNTLVISRLIPALEALQKQTGAPVHALGYCMGGTIMLGAAALRPDLFQAITLLAAPWDFHVGSGALAARVKFWAPSAMTALAQKDVLPSAWLQTLFASLDPLLAQKKFTRFNALPDDTPEERIFIAVEDWLNSGPDLPKAIARECIMEWFLNNAPVQGGWSIDGRIVDPAQIEVPSLIMASSRDRLVEFEGSSVLATLMPQANLVDPMCGHIGMIAGRRSVPEVWQPIANWINIKS